MRTKEEISAYQKEYRMKNLGKIKARDKIARQKNSELIKEKNKAYREKNKEKIKEYKKLTKDRIAFTRKERYYKNREKILAGKREKHANNKEYRDRINERRRADRKANPGKHRGWDKAKIERDNGKIYERQKRWRRNNRERFLASARKRRKKAYYKDQQKSIASVKAYREKYPERIKTALKKYREKHPEVIRAIEVRKRAAGKVSPEDVLTLMKNQDSKCYYCATDISKKYHIDHFFPIKLGGNSDIENLVLSCQPCNNKKSSKHPVLFMNELKAAM